MLCARTPTLPLSDTPVRVHCPLRDNVIGNRPSLPTRVTQFSRSLEQVSSSFRDGVTWRKPFLTAKKTMDSFSYYKKISDFRLETIQSNLPPSVSRVLNMYTELSQQSSFHAYNPRYSGGLLSCVQENCEDEIRHFLFHARGRNLNRLTLTIAAPSDSHLVRSSVVAESRVEKVFQVHTAAVQDNVFIATRHANSCSVFSVSKSDCMNTPLAFDETDLCNPSVSTNRFSVPTCNSTVLPNKAIQFKPLAICCFNKRTEVPVSVCVCPYLPGEGLFCSDVGTVKLWSASHGMIRTIERLPRFKCQDSWRHAYYVSHPRQVVLADRTAVQMFDHRDGFRNSLDLFALPSPLVHKNECIVAAHHHSNNSWLHVVATSHSVFMVDQRFAGTPVMQWYPDLEAPLQYLTSAEYHTDGGERRGVVLAGCQHPAEVMCYPFNYDSGQPVTSSLNPWRLSKMTDISSEQYYNYFHMAVSPFLFEERMRLSLAGMAVAKGHRSKSFVTYQADCYGEIFVQQYSTPDNPRTSVKTGVPPPGKKDHYVPDEVQSHVSLWLERLQKQVYLKNVRRGRESKEKQGIPLPAWMCQDSGSPSSAEETTERYSLYRDTTGTPSSGHRKTNDLLCGNRHDVYRRFRTKEKRTMQSNSASCFSLWLSDTDFTDGRNVSSSVNEGMSLLERVVPSLDGHETDAFSAVHLELRKPGQELIELVRKRFLGATLTKVGSWRNQRQGHSSNGSSNGQTKQDLEKQHHQLHNQSSSSSVDLDAAT